jgi:hypothetical protein
MSKEIIRGDQVSATSERGHGVWLTQNFGKAFSKVAFFISILTVLREYHKVYISIVSFAHASHSLCHRASCTQAKSTDRQGWRERQGG